MKSSKEMVAEANAEIRTISVAEAAALLGSDDVVFVDIRDPREIQRDGSIPGSFKAPRGMIEFWVDPESPYHKPVFSSGKDFVFFCASGWRSALATKTVKDMGLAKSSHIEGGFTAWKADGQPVELPPER